MLQRNSPAVHKTSHPFRPVGNELKCKLSILQFQGGKSNFTADWMHQTSHFLRAKQENHANSQLSMSAKNAAVKRSFWWAQQTVNPDATAKWTLHRAGETGDNSCHQHLLPVLSWLTLSFSELQIAIQDKNYKVSIDFLVTLCVVSVFREKLLSSCSATWSYLQRCRSA